MGPLKLLILAGGQSSRMGSPKHLLPVPSSNRPLYQQLIYVMHVAFPEIQTLHISIATSSTIDDVLQQGEINLPTTTGSKRIELVKIPDTTKKDIGPAAGLIAAHKYDPKANWLVVACDFPLLEPIALHQLKEAHKDPVTCFVNKDGFSEPLLAVWSPIALRSLVSNVDKGRSGPSYTVELLKGKLITPGKDGWVLNTNSPEEWEAARFQIKQLQFISGV